MNKDDLKNVEAYCPKETCGDPVPGFDGVLRYTKRRLVFMGVSVLGRAKYVCPVCSYFREFRVWGGQHSAYDLQQPFARAEADL